MRKVPIMLIVIVWILAACSETQNVQSSQENPPDTGTAPGLDDTPSSQQSVLDTTTSTPDSGADEQNSLDDSGSSITDTLQESGLFDLAWNDRTIYESGLIPEALSILEELPGASLYRLEMEIMDGCQIVGGKEEVVYTNMETEPLDEVYFRLFPNLAGGVVDVYNLKIDGDTVDPLFRSGNSALVVPLQEPLQPGERILIQMDFILEIPLEMGGNYGLFGYFDEILVLDLFYPVIPAYDQYGWYKDIPPKDGDISYFDASFYLVRVIAPEELVLAASGVEIAREEGGGKQVVSYAAGPARDFYIAASEHFESISETVGDTTVNCYTFPAFSAARQQSLNVALSSIAIFSERFGIYEYSEFDVVSTPMRALGIEYPGITGIALKLFDPDAVIIGLPSQVLLESTVAHEVGHNWFYNAVGNDQVRDAWLDEAIVQYITAIYYLDSYGQGAYASLRDSWFGRWDQIDRVEDPIGLDNKDYEEGHYTPIVYGHGPLFIEALSEEMGGETFDAFLRDYYQTYRWGIGTEEGFRQLAEEHCECDLSRLFEEWVYPR